jgi:hypothetical protein
MIRQIFFRFRVRNYFTSATDPNIRFDGNVKIARMKPKLYHAAKTYPIPDLQASAKASKEPKNSGSSIQVCLEELYLSAKISRLEGGIKDAQGSIESIRRISDNIEDLTRREMIRCLQVCSLLVNRNKLAVRQIEVVELEDVRKDLVQSCIRRLSGRLSDIPTSILSTMTSSIARQFETSFQGIMDEINSEILLRIRSSLSRDPSSLSGFRTSADLSRMVPYLLLAHSEIGKECPPSLVDASLDFFNVKLADIPYEALSLYVFALPNCSSLAPSETRLENLLDILLEKAQNDATKDDISLTDICRLCLGARKAMSRRAVRGYEILAKGMQERPSSEFTIHVMKDISGLLDETALSSREVRRVYFRELDRLRREIPPGYIANIFENLFRLKTLRKTDLLRFSKRFVAPNLRRMGEKNSRKCKDIRNSLAREESDPSK